MSSRPYRSKRQRPCDQCRERKLGCQTEAGLPCARCRSADLRCTFAKPPPKRPRRQREGDDGHSFEASELQVQPSIEAESSPSQLSSQHTSHQQIPVTAVTAATDATITTAAPSTAATAAATPVDAVLPPSPWTQQLISSGRAPTQFVQSLDQLEGFSAQLFGASAESDPWLLRHCSFDDAGVKCFYKVHFRNAGGVPVPLRIPVHFMIAADDLAEGAKGETRVAAGGSTREELNALVPHEYGQRLVGLYVSLYYYCARELLLTMRADSSSTSIRHYRWSPATNWD